MNQLKSVSTFHYNFGCFFTIIYYQFFCFQLFSLFFSCSAFFHFQTFLILNFNNCLNPLQFLYTISFDNFLNSWFSWYVMIFNNFFFFCSLVSQFLLVILLGCFISGKSSLKNLSFSALFFLQFCLYFYLNEFYCLLASLVILMLFCGCLLWCYWFCLVVLLNFLNVLVKTVLRVLLLILFHFKSLWYSHLLWYLYLLQWSCRLWYSCVLCSVLCSPTCFVSVRFQSKLSKKSPLLINVFMQSILDFILLSYFCGNL